MGRGHSQINPQFTRGSGKRMNFADMGIWLKLLERVTMATGKQINSMVLAVRGGLMVTSTKVLYFNEGISRGGSDRTKGNMCGRTETVTTVFGQPIKQKVTGF